MGMNISYDIIANLTPAVKAKLVRKFKNDLDIYLGAHEPSQCWIEHHREKYFTLLGLCGRLGETRPGVHYKHLTREWLDDGPQGLPTITCVKGNNALWHAVDINGDKSVYRCVPETMVETVLFGERNEV